jgi:hypothetical protein
MKTCASGASDPVGGYSASGPRKMLPMIGVALEICPSLVSTVLKACRPDINGTKV